MSHEGDAGQCIALTPTSQTPPRTFLCVHPTFDPKHLRTEQTYRVARLLCQSQKLTIPDEARASTSSATPLFDGEGLDFVDLSTPFTARNGNPTFWNLYDGAVLYMQSELKPLSQLTTASSTTCFTCGTATSVCRPTLTVYCDSGATFDLIHGSFCFSPLLIKLSAVCVSPHGGCHANTLFASKTIDEFLAHIACTELASEVSVRLMPSNLQAWCTSTIPIDNDLECCFPTC